MKNRIRTAKLAPATSQRSADRFDTALSVEIDGIPSLTRNISATGMYIETYAHQSQGSHVRFTVDVVVQGQSLKLVCEGEVVRVDQQDDLIGVAVKLDKSFFSNIETV